MGDEVTVGRNRPAHVRRQRVDALTAAKRQRFLDVVAATANVKRAAAEAGVAPASFYRLRQRDAGFAAAWDQSLDDGYAALEAMLLQRALGTAEQAPGNADRGGPIAFDPKLAMAMLQRRDERNKVPSNYGKRSGSKHVPMAGDAVDRRVSAAPSILADEIVARARALVGARFRLHGRGADGVDCVGLAAAALGLTGVPSGYPLRGGDARAVADLIGTRLRAATGARARGDLLLMETGPGPLHLGVWTGGGLVHADLGLGRVVERPGEPPWPVLGRWR